MGELTDRAEGLHALVVAVAGDAVLLDQLLVKRDVLLLTADGHPLGGQEPDLVHPVADDTLLGRAAPEGRVASEAVGGELQMGVHQLSGTDHQVRGDEGEHQQGRQIDQDDGDDGFSVHFHCQKRKMLRM